MAFDGIVTYAIVEELKSKLITGRIDKIYQPEDDEIYLSIRSRGENYGLVISANSSNPRFHLTDKKKKNPMEPPMFCMVLRKHLLGASISNIEQLSMDRVVFIDLISKDELGFDSNKRLIIEIMGRHSNIILIDSSTGRIIESVKRVSQEMSSFRQVFPGHEYSLPPEQDKLNPLTSTREEFLKHLEASENLPAFKFFYFNYIGLSPLISREFIHRAGLPRNIKISELDQTMKDSLAQVFLQAVQDLRLKDFSPNIVFNRDENKILGFHALDLSQFEDSKKEDFPEISSLLDKLFIKKDEFDRVSQKSQNLKRAITTNLDRARKKLKKQEKEYKESLDREIYKVYADLLSANFYRIQPGDKKITVDNFYSENLESLEIPLDEKISGPLNAQRYYKKYSKLKNASKLLSKEIPRTKVEIIYLENTLLSLEQATDTETLEDIKEELSQEGYIENKKAKRKKTSESKPHHYIASNGMDILVGKNNRQNDELTLKTSSRDDLWFHVQNMPGSHVIIRNNGEEVDQASLMEAASLAAYYSNGRKNSRVAVDYTERKNVRKPKGAKLGMVIYENFKTLDADPRAIDKIKKL